MGHNAILIPQAPALNGHWETPPTETLRPHWQAQWIWLPTGNNADMLLARRTFTLSDKPDRAILFISASSLYTLWINGKYICCGPARCAPHHQSYDVLDIKKILENGENVLAIRVHHQRQSRSYEDPSRAGLLAQLECTHGNQTSTLQTDSSWHVTADESWLKASPMMARFHLEVCDRVDLRRQINGWNTITFDAHHWPKAQVLKRETGWPTPQQNDRPTHLTPPWTTLVARDIPYLDETLVKLHRPIHTSRLPEPEQQIQWSKSKWLDAAAIPQIPVSLSSTAAVHQATDSLNSTPLIITANNQGTCAVLVFDLDTVQNGRPFLHIKAPAGSIIDIMSAPYLLNEHLQTPIVASTYVDRIILSGKRDHWEATYMKPARWLAVVFRHLPAAAELYQIGIRRNVYPFKTKGFFRTPDNPKLEMLWQAAAKTIQVCTSDAYTDNYRERRQYAQTSYYACLGNYPIFGDYALQQRYLRQLAEDQLANGIMPAYAPRHGNDFMVILDANCFWLRGLHQYLLYSGDRYTVQQLLPAAHKLLHLLHSFTNAIGLIDNPPYPYWLDHTLNDRRGANFCLNSHYLGALEDFAQVLQWLDTPDSCDYSKRASQVRRSLQEHLWDPQQQLFADALIDGVLSTQFSEHANAMALALKIANSTQTAIIAKKMSLNEPHDFVRRASGLIMVTPAMSYFLLTGLCEAGYIDAAWELLQSRFDHMLQPQTNGTLWEEWWLDGSGRSGRFKPLPSGRSDAQTESAFIPALWTRYILGIEPCQPGLERVILHYYHSNHLDQRHGAIPTPSGLLEITWDVQPTQFKITLQIPPHLTVNINLASLTEHSTRAILINDKAATDQQFIKGYLVLPPGAHNVCIDRPPNA